MDRAKIWEEYSTVQPTHGNFPVYPRIWYELSRLRPKYSKSPLRWPLFVLLSHTLVLAHGASVCQSFYGVVKVQKDKNENYWTIHLVQIKPRWKKRLKTQNWEIKDCMHPRGDGRRSQLRLKKKVEGLFASKVESSRRLFGLQLTFNTQIQKYTFAQVHKYTNTQM